MSTQVAATPTKSLPELAAECAVLTLDQAAPLLGMSYHQAHKLAKKGEFPGLLPRLDLREYRISAPLLLQWVQSGGGQG